MGALTLTVVGPASEGIQKKPSVSRPSSATLDSALRVGGRVGGWQGEGQETAGWGSLPAVGAAAAAAVVPAAAGSAKRTGGPEQHARTRSSQAAVPRPTPQPSPVQADEDGDGGQGGQAARQRVHARRLVQLGSLNLRQRVATVELALMGSQGARRASTSPHGQATGRPHAAASRGMQPMQPSFTAAGPQPSRHASISIKAHLQPLLVPRILGLQLLHPRLQRLHAERGLHLRGGAVGRAGGGASTLG